MGDVRPLLWALLGSVGFVLLIACVNVGNLMLGFGARRRREMALHAAIGAGRKRMIRQSLTESLALSLLGGLLGLLFAIGGIALVRSLRLGNLPRLENVQIDARAFAFALAVSVLTGLIFGIAPALRASSADVNSTLKEGGKSTPGKERHRLRDLLVVADVALALVLLAGAGLMMKSFARLLDVRPGFDPSHALTMGISLWGRKTADAPLSLFLMKYSNACERARRGIDSVVSQIPLGIWTATEITWRANPHPIRRTIRRRSLLDFPRLPAHQRIPLLSGRGSTKPIA